MSHSLLQKAKSGNSLAWDEIVSYYGPVVLGFVIKRGVASRSDAEEIVQQVFIAVFQRLKRFTLDDPSSSFTRYLVGIAKHKVADYFRESHTRAAGGTTAQQAMQNVQVSEALVDQAELRAFEFDVFWLGFDKLRKKIGHTLKFRCFEAVRRDRLSNAEAAERLGVSEHKVRAYVSRMTRELEEKYAGIFTELEMFQRPDS